MHLKVLFSIFFFLCFISILSVSSDKLLVITFGGFTDDEKYRDLMPHLRSLRKCGAWIQNVPADFPSTTLPLHMSIATGYGVKHHGVFSDYQFDSATGECKNQADVLAESDHSTWSALKPIWSLYKEGRLLRTGLMMWPGGQMISKGSLQPTYFHPTETKHTMEYCLNIVISWFLNIEQPADLVMFHIDGPSKVSEMYGPESLETMNEIRKVDNFIDFMMYKIYGGGGLEAKIPGLNIVFITDHTAQKVPYKTLIPFPGMLMCGKSPVMHIKSPTPFNESQIKELIKWILVFNNKAKITDSFKLNADDFLLIARPGSGFLYDMEKIASKMYHENGLLYSVNKSIVGVSGYDTSGIVSSPNEFSSYAQSEKVYYKFKIIAMGPKIERGKFKSQDGKDPQGFFIHHVNDFFIDLLGLSPQNKKNQYSILIKNTAAENENWHECYYKSGFSRMTSFGQSVPEYPYNPYN